MINYTLLEEITADPKLTTEEMLKWYNYNPIIIHWELLRLNETIDSKKYYEQLDKLNENLIKKHPALVNREGVIFQQDNARPHVSKITSQKIKVYDWK